MIDKIYFFYYPVEWTRDSLGWALSGVASKIGAKYIEKHYVAGQWHIDDVIPSNEKCLVFFIYETKREERDFKSLKNKCPNAMTVQISCDGQEDYGTTGYYNPECVDFHLDLIEEYAEKVNDRGFHAELFWWTVSEKTLDIIKLVPEFDRDIDFICLCKRNYSRNRFFSEIEKYYKLVAGINCYDMWKVVELYKRSKLTLGISHSSHDGCPRRSMKAFRDWMGPLCGSILISDDYPQMVKYFNGITPFYQYNNPHSLIESIKHINVDTLENQKLWILNNFIEQQLYKMFNKWGLLNN